MGGNLEVAAQLLGLVRVGMDSARFSSCLSFFTSSSVGILMSMLSGQPVLLLSLWSLWSESSLLIGPHSLQSVTSESGMLRLYSSGGSLCDSQQLFWLLYLTMNQKQFMKSNSTGKYVPLFYTKYPVSSPTFSKDVALTNFLGTLRSPLQLRGIPPLKTFSALDTVRRFDLMSQDNGLWLEST